MCYDYPIIKLIDDKSTKEPAMSILTVVDKNNEGRSELVNRNGAVIAWLDNHTKEILLQQGIKEKVVYEK